MSQTQNQKKYDALLNRFLKIDNLIEENGGERMKRWLEEAANGILGQFQNHRGKTMDKFVLITMKSIFLGDVGQLNNTTNEDKVSHNNTNALETAMCISLSSDSSDEESHEEDKKSIYFCLLSIEIFGLCYFYYRPRNVHAKAIYPR